MASPPLPVTIDDIRAAARAIDGAVSRTPCLASGTLSQLTGAAVSLKLENLQYTASFKERGALNRLLALDGDEKARGVIAMSAGNHAQAVAYHAARLGIPATIVMPTDTPFIKITNTERLGATIILHGDTLDESARHAETLCKKQKLTFVHPYDDPLVIAGQGTAALEWLADAPDLDVLVVPVGGGGLIAGCAIAAKAIKPDIEIIGVQAALFPAMQNALAGGTSTVEGATIADGIAVKSPGKMTRQIIAKLVDDIILVEESRIEHAVHLLVEIEKMVVEGAGAAALAAVLQEQDRFAGRSVGLMISGGNIDSRTLATVLMRGLVSAGRLMRLRVELPDTPGSLSRVTALIGSLGGNIVELEHNRWFRDVPARMTGVDFLIEIRQDSDAGAIIQGIVDQGLKARLLSSNAVE
ncbi:MAG: threonine ammonia-lyase [Rhodospirillaceae bacterium]|nr:threonine ammonia-lyase [Rhodospirillaceae bacterium]MBT5455069.1 threonine ammonia-lyase [Rhodospirillaceae bacterium]